MPNTWHHDDDMWKDYHRVRWTQSVTTLMDVYHYFVERNYEMIQTKSLQRNGDKVTCTWEAQGIIAEIYPIPDTRTWMFRAWRMTGRDEDSLRLALAVTQAVNDELTPDVEKIFSAKDDKWLMRYLPTYDGCYNDERGSSVLCVINHLMETVYTDHMTSRIEADNLRFYTAFLNEDHIVEGEWNGYYFWGPVASSQPYLLIARNSADCHSGKRLWKGFLTLKPDTRPLPAWGIGIGDSLTPTEPEYDVLSTLPNARDFSGKDITPEQFAALFAACARRLERNTDGGANGLDFPEKDPIFAVNIRAESLDTALLPQ